MPENNSNNLESRTTQELEFQQFVKNQFELLFARMNKLEEQFDRKLDQKIDGVREEMRERFVQLSRQMRQMDKMMDVFIADHLSLKDEWREMRDSQAPKN